MYGIFTYIDHELKPNVGKYTAIPFQEEMNEKTWKW